MFANGRGAVRLVVGVVDRGKNERLDEQSIGGGRQVHAEMTAGGLDRARHLVNGAVCAVEERAELGSHSLRVL